MKMNKKGTELYDIWAKKYADENDRLGGNSENGDFVIKSVGKPIKTI